MEDTRPVSRGSGWDAVYVRNVGRRVAPLRPKYRTWLALAGFVLILAGVHACIAYFGWGWLKSQQAPIYSELPATATGSTKPELEAARRIRVDDSYEGQMRWNRRDGMTVAPKVKPEWKCAGGFYFTTSRGADGSTVVEMVERGDRPVRCGN